MKAVEQPNLASAASKNASMGIRTDDGRDEVAEAMPSARLGEDLNVRVCFFGLANRSIVNVVCCWEFWLITLVGGLG